ncbi:hypothetical protein K2173_005154 [Erythroxylum novogranatense]|uniref:Uncharacterized protein n=1 Tax=Erythroxylum novogranatense TaxID=1862640 RepID=A0AAV8TRI8_9ROSI|nr:hypothetical protein K2173_005154 [Erythroxylum novogranatense]
MGRSPCCGDESGVKKGPWTPEEDQKLVKYIQKHGHGSWRALPKLAGLNRCGKSCRLRWTNYLRPDIKRGKFSAEEEQTILNLHAVLGNKWSAIAGHLPGRTDNEIKNFWNTHLKKKLIQMGFDPMTHQPRTDIFSSLSRLIALANLMDGQSMEEHAARLQAEAAQMARLQYLQYLLHYQPPASMATSSNNLDASSFSDMDSLSLLNLTPTFLQELNDITFSHLPNLQLPPLKKEQPTQAPDFAVFTQDENSPSSPYLPACSLPSPPSVAAIIPQPSPVDMADDSSIVSSYLGEASSIWSDHLLLEHPLFQEIA